MAIACIVCKVHGHSMFLLWLVVGGHALQENFKTAVLRLNLEVVLTKNVTGPAKIELS